MAASAGGGVAGDGAPIAFSTRWVDADGAADSDQDSTTSLRVMTLNILADALARGSEDDEAPSLRRDVGCPEIFEVEGVGGVAYGPKPEGSCFQFSCSKAALAWPRRWPKLKALILQEKPDVIGLQEIDLMDDAKQNLQSHDKEIRRDLASEGFSGVFAKKMGRACDGVALFWRTSRLQAVGTPQTWKLARTVHVALAQVLKVSGGPSFTAVATHLKAGLGEEAETQRTEQASFLLGQLKSHQNAIVLADLNAHCRPTQRSGEPPPPPPPPAGGKAAGKSKSSSVGRLEEQEPRAYPLLCKSMQSAYAMVLGDEPSFTCWGGWVDREVRLVCDYILLKGCKLWPRRVLQVPDMLAILEYPERLPNEDHPTDHVPLAVDLAFDPVEDVSAAQQPWKRQRQW